MEERITSKEEAQKIIDKYNEDVELSNLESMIIDNKIEFEHKEIKYRVRLLTFKEKSELAQLKIKKFNSMLQEKDDKGNFVYLTEYALTDLYRERGINIDEINDAINKIEAQIKSEELSLGEALAKNESEVILKTYKDKIINLNNQKQIYSIQNNNLFRLSLENQLLNYEAEIITYLTLDILFDNKWVRKFNTYNEFINYEDEELINKAGTRSMLLQYL